MEYKVNQIQHENSPKFLPIIDFEGLFLESPLPEETPPTMIPKIESKIFFQGPNSFGFDSGYTYLELGWSWARNKLSKTPFAVLLEATIDDGSCLFHSIMKECGSIFNLIDVELNSENKRSVIPDFAYDKEFLSILDSEGMLKLNYNDINGLNNKFKANNTYLNRNLYINQFRKILTNWLQRTAINPLTNNTYTIPQAIQYINSNPEILKIIIREYIRDPYRVKLSQNKHNINILLNRALMGEFQKDKFPGYFGDQKQDFQTAKSHIRSLMKNYITSFCGNNVDEELMNTVLRKPNYSFTELLITPQKSEAILNDIFKNDPLDLVLKLIVSLNGTGLIFLTPRMIEYGNQIERWYFQTNPNINTLPKELVNFIDKYYSNYMSTVQNGLPFDNLDIPIKQIIIRNAGYAYGYLIDERSPLKLKIIYFRESVKVQSTPSTVFIEIINAFERGIDRGQLMSELSTIIPDKKSAVFLNISKYIEEVQRIKNIFTNSIIDIIHDGSSYKFAELKSDNINSLAESGSLLREILINYINNETNLPITSSEIDSLLSRDPRYFKSEGNTLIPLFDSQGNLISDIDEKSTQIDINSNFFILGRGRVLINPVFDTNYSYIMNNLPRWVIWAGEDFIRLLNEMFALRIIVTNGYTDFISIYRDYFPSSYKKEDCAVVFVNYTTGIKGSHYQTLRAVTYDEESKVPILQSVFRGDDYWPRMADLYPNNLTRSDLIMYSPQEYYNIHKKAGNIGNKYAAIQPIIHIDTRIDGILNSTTYQDPASLYNNVSPIELLPVNIKLPPLPLPNNFDPSPLPPKLGDFIKINNININEISLPDVTAMYESIYGQPP